MNFKEMCAQKRIEKDRDIAVRREALNWLEETLSVLQEIPNIDLIVDDDQNVIIVLLGVGSPWKVKIETGDLCVTGLFSRWRVCAGQSYHVTISRRAPRESSSFHQIKEGVKGHKELRKAIQFWLAKMVVDNNWDKTIL
jgi:hypothetical protein